MKKQEQKSINDEERISYKNVIKHNSLQRVQFDCLITQSQQSEINGTQTRGPFLVAWLEINWKKNLLKMVIQTIRCSAILYI